MREKYQVDQVHSGEQPELDLRQQQPNTHSSKGIPEHEAKIGRHI
jgi:hypothetical protein